MTSADAAAASTIGHIRTGVRTSAARVTPADGKKTAIDPAALNQRKLVMDPAA